MNTLRISNSTRGRGRIPDLADFGEIQSIPEGPLEPKLRSQLMEAEEQLSIPAAEPPPRLSAVLNTVVGLRLTVDNPVWTGDPIPGLRALQKKLVECSLTLEGNDRSECTTAISLVEKAVQLRLRWLQMQRSEAERAFDGKQGKPEEPRHAEETKKR